MFHYGMFACLGSALGVTLDQKAWLECDIIRGRLHCAVSGHQVDRE